MTNLQKGMKKIIRGTTQSNKLNNVSKCKKLAALRQWKIVNIPGKLTPLYDTAQLQKLVQQQVQSAAMLKEQKQQFYPFQTSLGK
jgi:hypothetical protein